MTFSVWKALTVGPVESLMAMDPGSATCWLCLSRQMPLCLSFPHLQFGQDSGFHFRVVEALDEMAHGKGLVDSLQNP